LSYSVLTFNLIF